MRTFKSEDIRKLDALLLSADRPVIVTHMRPDGDALGSSTGMFHALRAYQKHPVIVLMNPAPANLDFLLPEDVMRDVVIYENDSTAAEKAIMDSDLVICLDFNALHRTDMLESPLLATKAPKILIDHHLSPDSEKFELMFSEQEISSASELLYHILLELPAFYHNASALPAEAATALLTGMTTDTNNFANSVYPSTFSMASELISAGVDRDLILARLYNRFKESRIRLQGLMLNERMKITQDGVAYMVLDKETMVSYNVEEGDTEGFVNIPLTIGCVRISIFVKEDDGYARVSVRSKKGTSANLCAKLHFHGGGHENAAGGRLFIPEDITDISQAGSYIETVTHNFFKNE